MALVHAVDLRNRNMRLVDDDERIVEKKSSEQCGRSPSERLLRWRE